MSKQLSSVRRQILVQMESILGGECYNGNIQNYGAGGVREAAGRSFRYPVMLRASDGSRSKVQSTSIPPTATDEMVKSAYYAFGANQLDVMAALEKVLQYLENNHGLVVVGEKPDEITS